MFLLSLLPPKPLLSLFLPFFLFSFVCCVSGFFLLFLSFLSLFLDLLFLIVVDLVSFAFCRAMLFVRCSCSMISFKERQDGREE
jgi:hypothetical protein